MMLSTYIEIKKGWWWCFSVFLESLILTVCWYGTGRFINSKVTPHVRKSWGCEGFRTLRRESRFSSFMGPSLKEFLSRWWCWAEKENWDRVVHAFSSQSHYGLSQLTLRHFHYSLLNTLLSLTLTTKDTSLLHLNPWAVAANGHQWPHVHNTRLLTT